MFCIDILEIQYPSQNGYEYNKDEQNKKNKRHVLSVEHEIFI